MDSVAAIAISIKVMMGVQARTLQPKSLGRVLGLAVAGLLLLEVLQVLRVLAELGGLLVETKVMVVLVLGFRCLALINILLDWR
jgi:hypothetical protein